MKSIICVLFACVISHITIAQKKGDFSLIIIQNGKTITPDQNDKITLEKKPFELVFIFKRETKVLLNASLDSTSFNQAAEYEDVNKIKGYGWSGLAEGRNNKGKELFIHDLAPSMWYYSDESDNRFDKIEFKKRNIVCTRTIKQFLLLENDNKVVKVEDIDSSIFLIFSSYKYDTKAKKVHEFERKRLKIDF